VSLRLTGGVTTEQLKFRIMKSLKLNVLASENLSKVEMNQVRGGECCACGCQGPSSTEDNGIANMEQGKKSPGGGKPFCSGKLEEVVVMPK
jgi:natural product precursor